ncbi:MAG: copper amine oxidase N-terminal domain-containing protein [Clostridia bacterium]|nr:copper amine oxidase N-terminal domain-containing protein [Clostridia bacterium]
MKKTICLMLVLMLLCVSTLPVFAEERAVSVELKGEMLTFPDTQPQLVNGRTMVPMRFIFEKLGASIWWDDANQTVFAFTEQDTMVMQIGSDRMFINDEPLALDVPPQLIGERTMVPLRAVSESFGLKVEWNDETSTVIITE